MPDSREVLARAISGDESAWREIVARYQALVFHVIRAHRIEAQDGEDLFQEAFLRLHRHGHRIEDSAALTRWLAVTTRHLCLDHLARRSRESGNPEVRDEPDPGPGPGEELERSLEAQRVREALATLSERCRTLLGVLYYELDEPDYRRAAEKLGMPVGSVGPTRLRCLAKLLAALEEQETMYPERVLRRPFTRTKS
ncbi:MAG: RNA polymerase sigma factor [Candidatus Eiseniibacteriota bacterium]